MQTFAWLFKFVYGQKNLGHELSITMVFRAMSTIKCIIGKLFKEQHFDNKRLKNQQLLELHKNCKTVEYDSIM